MLPFCHQLKSLGSISYFMLKVSQYFGKLKIPLISKTLMNDPSKEAI